MSDFEDRLGELLRSAAPEPRRAITSVDIARLTASTPAIAPTRRRGGVRGRWKVPILAAAALLLIVVVPIVVFGLHSNRGSGDDDTPLTGPVTSSTGSAAPSATDSPTYSSPGPTQSATNPVQINPSTPVPSRPLSVTPTQTPRSPAASSSPSGGWTLTLCRSAGLALTAGRTDGAAGSGYTTFSLRNTSTATCGLTGFPGVSFLDSAGAIVGQPADRDPGAGTLVRLKPDESANFVLRNSLVTQPGCDTPRPSTQMQVYPPDNTQPLRIDLSTESCRLYVGPVTHG